MNAFSAKLPMTWCVLTAVFRNEMDYRYQSQAKGIDRPSFGATLIKNQDKYHLSEREQAWLVGAMAYVP